MSFPMLYLSVLLCVGSTYALYDSSSEVVDLNPSNFDNLVTNTDMVWIVEFYAPWCGHCKNLVPEYTKAAQALKNVVKVGAVDADKHKALASKYGVTGFPTIKIFTGSKHTPYQGQRTAEAFVETALKAAKDKVYEALRGKKSSGSSSDKHNAKNKFLGHSIPWKKVTMIKTQTTKPDRAKLQLKHLQEKLFRSRYGDSDGDPKIVKYIVGNTHIFGQLLS